MSSKLTREQRKAQHRAFRRERAEREIFDSGAHRWDAINRVGGIGHFVLPATCMGFGLEFGKFRQFIR